MNPCGTGRCRSDDRELFRVGDELRQGRQAATDLLGLMRQQEYLSAAANATSSDPALGLAMKIVDSFSNSLSMLGCQDPAAMGGGSSESNNKRSSSSSGGRKRNKPRKADSWTEVTSALIDDGHAWRKYGQKPILNAKHPRNYFRCTSKPDCQALKRVQKMDDNDDDDRPMYKIIHTGLHTCLKPLNPSNVFGDMDSSIYLNFEISEQRNNKEPSDSLEILATLSPEFTVREVSKDNQTGSSSTPLSENAETDTSPSENAQCCFDDFDYLIGSLEFNEYALSGAALRF
uniref:WRKY domain-containing protein n=1 Tax=Kalanchoe fedtschenkoi TaxID=63787 RepID=A0A7N0VBG2_KALFE